MGNSDGGKKEKVVFCPRFSFSFSFLFFLGGEIKGLRRRREVSRVKVSCSFCGEEKDSISWQFFETTTNRARGLVIVSPPNEKVTLGFVFLPSSLFLGEIKTILPPLFLEKKFCSHATVSRISSFA